MQIQHRRTKYTWLAKKKEPNKKVLLRERKRHTDRCVSSTPSAVLSRKGTPSPARGYPIPGWEEGVLPSWGTSPSWPGWGVPHPWTGGYPCPDLGPVTGVPLERTWDQWKYYGMEIGYPPRKYMEPVEVLWNGDGDWVTPPSPPVWTDWKHNLPSRTSYAVGN